MIHGNKKTDKKKSEEQVKEETELTDKINTKLGEFFAVRRQPVEQAKLPALIQFTTILMQLCPDITTIFNYRRELIELVLRAQDPQGQAKTLAGDIKLNTKIIQGDPKSYTLWSYRQWLVLKLFAIDTSIIKKEKELCTLLLTKDEKNFHVWNYRNWVNGIYKDIDEELEFTRAKINSNPFNFSPYHFRSKYIAQKYSALLDTLPHSQKLQVLSYGMPKQVFDTELQTVRTAIFLNPKEQAPWLYHTWLLKQLLPTIVLEVRPLQQGQAGTLYSILLNQSIGDFRQSVSIEGGREFTLRADKAHSNLWTLVAEVPIAATDIKFNGGAGLGSRLYQPGEQFIEEVRLLYQAEETFIQEVLESEDNVCRFAWLQLLQTYKLQLYLQLNPDTWSTYTSKAVGVFENLESETKGQKYIQKQRKEWERLHESKNLTQLQTKLKVQ